VDEFKIGQNESKIFLPYQRSRNKGSGSLRFRGHVWRRSRQILKSEQMTREGSNMRIVKANDAYSTSATHHQANVDNEDRGLTIGDNPLVDSFRSHIETLVTSYSNRSK
jgi:hypothetical protein